MSVLEEKMMPGCVEAMHKLRHLQDSEGASLCYWVPVRSLGLMYGNYIANSLAEDVIMRYLNGDENTSQYDKRRAKTSSPLKFVTGAHSSRPKEVAFLRANIESGSSVWHGELQRKKMRKIVNVVIDKA